MGNLKIFFKYQSSGINIRIIRRKNNDNLNYNLLSSNYKSISSYLSKQEPLNEVYNNLYMYVNTQRHSIHNVPMYVCVLSHVQLFVTPWTAAHQVLCARNFPGKNTGVGCHFLLQGIFPAQGSNPCLLHLLHWQDSTSSTDWEAPNIERCNIYKLTCSAKWFLGYIPSQNSKSM